MEAPVRKFRKCFNITKDKINWYPGHMDRSFKHMQAKMRKVNCVIEVHDSRIPFSGRNPRFLGNVIGPRPHILVLNKKDLINKSSFKMIEERCHEEVCENVVFTNCLDKNCKGLNGIISLAIDLIQRKNVEQSADLRYTLMIIGVPNVGKSSLINALRNRTLGKAKSNAVGAEAGVTRSVQNEVKVCSNPPTYLIDTPGILLPNINDIESGMKLAVCACLKDSVVGIYFIADFLLYWMNKVENFIYVDYFGLSQPTDDVFPLLVKIAVDKNYTKKVKNVQNNSLQVIPDIDAAANFMVTLFRKGEFGDLGLDRNHLNNECL